MNSFPVIDPEATGVNIRRLRIERGITVRDLQSYFGFEEPRAIYKWQIRRKGSGTVAIFLPDLCRRIKAAPRIAEREGRSLT